MSLSSTSVQIGLALGTAYMLAFVLPSFLGGTDNTEVVHHTGLYSSTKYIIKSGRGGLFGHHHAIVNATYNSFTKEVTTVETTIIDGETIPGGEVFSVEIPGYDGNTIVFVSTSEYGHNHGQVYYFKTTDTELKVKYPNGDVAEHLRFEALHSHPITVEKVT